MKRTPLKRGKPPRRKTRVKARNAKRGGHRFPHNVDEAYRDYIRALPCVARSIAYRTHCFGRVVCAHLKTRGSGGLDRGNTVPLCVRHHAEQEGNTAGFNERYGLDLAAIAAKLADEYRPPEIAW
jgi:hypothetical protein